MRFFIVVTVIPTFVKLAQQKKLTIQKSPVFIRFIWQGVVFDKKTLNKDSSRIQFGFRFHIHDSNFVG